MQLSSDRGLQLTLVTLEFVVIGFYQSPVNKSMPLALTEIKVLSSYSFNMKMLKGQRIYSLYYLMSENLIIVFQRKIRAEK